LLLWRKTTI